MGDECRRARQGDHGQGGADRLGEADTDQNCERGNDQEASADAVETGQRPGRKSDGKRTLQEAAAPTAEPWCLASPADDPDCGGEEQEREACEDRLGIDEPIERGAREGTDRCRA